MMDTAITFSTEYFHENSFSWTLGAFCDDESQNLEFVRTSNSDLSAIHLSIRDTMSFWHESFVFRVVSSLESCYAHCKSFFIESPFARPVKKAAAALKKVVVRGFRNVSGSFLNKGRAAAQANLGIFTL